MQYQTVLPATFLSRPNRFIAHCLVEGREVIAHVKNTGRCRELLLPGVTVWLEYAPSPTRSTDYSLVAVEKGERLINMDSQAPNKVTGEALLSGALALPGMGPLTRVKAEAKVDSSRLDFLVEDGCRTGYLEVKGVTLEENGVVLFPDAPTERGVKHLLELAELAQRGLATYILLVVQMEDVDYFIPNDRTHPQFGQALRQARQAGVQLLCRDCHVTPNSMSLRWPVEMRL